MIENLIYDLGMNNGDDTRHYLARGFRVIAVEANPQLVEIVSRELAEFLDSGQLTILNLGIAERQATLDFWVNRHHQWSSFDSELGRREDPHAYSIPVACRPLASLFSEYGVPFYLKLDIEGSDLMALDALDASDLPQFISVEADGKRPVEKLAILGYPHFKLIDQFTHFPMDDPLDWEFALFLALGETNRAQTPFPFGSSGPFGAQLPGRWRNLDEILHSWEYHRQLQLRHPTHRRVHWCDFHAALRLPETHSEPSTGTSDADETLQRLIHSVSGIVENERRLAQEYRQWAERSDSWLVSERQAAREICEQLKKLEAERLVIDQSVPFSACFFTCTDSSTPAGGEVSPEEKALAQ